MADYIEREAVHRMMVGLIRYRWTSPVSEESRVTVDADDVNFGVDHIPAADVAPVVRCKDCENFVDAKGKDSGKQCGYGQCKVPTGIRGIVCADDFCSFAKRMDEEGW